MSQLNDLSLFHSDRCVPVDMWETGVDARDKMVTRAESLLCEDFYCIPVWTTQETWPKVGTICSHDGDLLRNVGF